MQKLRSSGVKGRQEWSDVDGEKHSSRQRREVGLKTEAENRERLDSRPREAGLKTQREAGLRLDPDRERLDQDRERLDSRQREVGLTQDMQITVS